MINTTHNVSQKLCLAAARVLRRVSAIAEDTDTSLDLETVTYLLEDTNIAHTQHRNKISTELAGRIQSGNVQCFLIFSLSRNSKKSQKVGASF